MTVFNQARMRNFNVGSVNQAIQNKAANNPYLAKMTNQNAAVAALKQDTYTPANRVMSYEDFYELMTSDKSAQEKHAALVEAYGDDVLSFCAYETGMKAVKNGSFSLEEFHFELERRAESLRISPRGKSQFSMIAPGPNDEDVARSIELSKKMIPIQNKMLAGKALSAAEKSFVQEHFPEYYAKAIQIEQEVTQLKARLRAAKSKEEAAQIYMETKLQAMSGGKNDKGILLMAPAIDEAYNNFRKDKNW